VAYSEDDQLTVGGVANTSVATAQSISPSVPIFGTLGGGEVHYFKFNANAGQLVTFMSYASRLDMNGWDTSLRMRLLGPDGTTELARSGAISPDAPGIDTGLGVSIPATGVYYLACDQDQKGFASGKFGVLLYSPTLPLGAALQTEAEPQGKVGGNDTAATAEALLPGFMYGHYDNPSTNVSASDYYKISVTAAARLHLEIIAARLGAANGGELWDAALSLQDSAGNVLWSSDNTYFLDPSIDYIVTTPGTYYVRVTRSEYATNTASSPYFLYYSPSAYTPVAAAAGTTAATAPVVAYGSDISGSFAAAGSQYFSFSGTAGDVVRLVVQDKSQLQGATTVIDSGATSNTVTPAGPSTGAIASPGSIAVATTQIGVVAAPVLAPSGPVAVKGTGLDAVLLSSDGVSQLALAAANSSATESRVNSRQTILQATGKYYVRVTSGAAGEFGFRVENVTTTSREVEPNDTAATATAIGANGWSSGVISSTTDKDHFRIHGEAGQLVSVSLLAAAGGGMGTALADWGSSLVPVVEVRDAAGNLIATTSADRKGLTNFAESTLHTDTMTETSFRAPTGADYDVTVYDADSQGGAAYFYALHVGKNQ